MDPGAVSIVMPAHNEEEMLASSVGDVLSGMRARGAPFEIIIVENGSSDRTAAIATELAGAHPEVRAVTRSQADYGGALRTGFLSATGEVVVNFDVDFVDLGFLHRALELMGHDGPTLVIGSKRTAGASDSRPWYRRVVTAGFSSLLRYGFGLRASDTHGVKAMRRQTLAPLVEACQLGTDLFDTELVLRAERANLAVAEVPVTVEERRPPRSSISRRALRTLAGLARLRRALRR